MTVLGGAKQSKLMAISIAPSLNYTNSKRTSVGAFTLTQTLDNSGSTASQTNFNGQPAYLLSQTAQPTCTGDEPGWAGGVKSGTVGKEVKPTSASGTIIVEGKQLVREGDSCTMNNANTIGRYFKMSSGGDLFDEDYLKSLPLFAGPIQEMSGLNDWGSSAFYLAKWSREQGHTPLETSRLLSEYNSGTSYKEGFHPILSTNRPNAPVSSKTMYAHYMYGRGQPLTLENLGAQQLVQDAVLRENAFNSEGSIQSRFLNQIIEKYKSSDTDYSFDNGYEIGDEIGIWAFGSGSIKGQFNGTIKEESSEYLLSGRIKYQFYDDFKDPYDTFDLIPGSWDPNGDSYHISGSWDNQINTIIPKDP